MLLSPCFQCVFTNALGTNRCFLSVKVEVSFPVFSQEMMANNKDEKDSYKYVFHIQIWKKSQQICVIAKHLDGLCGEDADLLVMKETGSFLWGGREEAESGVICSRLVKEVLGCLFCLSAVNYSPFYLLPDRPVVRILFYQKCWEMLIYMDKHNISQLKSWEKNCWYTQMVQTTT